MTIRVCVVTGTRADYGHLASLLKLLRDDQEIELQLIVAAMHLSAEHGNTIIEIQQDGFEIAAKVESVVEGNDGSAVARSTALALVGFSNAFANLRPDVVLLLGDRYEMGAAAQAALFSKHPIVHINGGDNTAGSYDDAIRHFITKCAQLHFVTSTTAARRVAQLGEAPDSIFNVGSLSLDNIKQTALLSREELESSLDFRFKQRNILVTYHPATADEVDATEELNELLAALDCFGSEVGIIFTKPNHDTGGAAIIEVLKHYVSSRPHTALRASLGRQRYYSAVNIVDVVLGNSSSGIHEAPVLKTPTVNVGNRQRGRFMPSSVLSVDGKRDQIHQALLKAFATAVTDTSTEYGDGTAGPKILATLKEQWKLGKMRSVLKDFHDL